MVPHLNYIRINLVDSASAFILDHLKKAHRQCVVVETSARMQTGYDDSWFGYRIVPGEIVHGLTHVPAVGVVATKNALVPGKGQDGWRRKRTRKGTIGTNLQIICSTVSCMMAKWLMGRDFWIKEVSGKCLNTCPSICAGFANILARDI